MKIADLIAALQRIHSERGNVEVICGSFCGTNNGHVTFHFKPIDVETFRTTDKMTGDGRCSLSIIQDTEAIIKSIKVMEDAGYTYYRSQFVGPGEQPKAGLSCNWHTLQ